MITNFKTNLYNTAGNASDFGDLFIPRALFSDGGLWLWGRGTNGQLGDNTVANKSSPVQTVSGGNNWKLVAGGVYHTAALKTDGTLWSWGRGTNGNLGDNTIVSKSSPVQTVSGGTNWKLVSGGYMYTAAIKTDGTLWTWGINTDGRLGNNTITDKSSPIQTVSGGTNWKSLSCAYGGMASIKTDGTLWLWGRNAYGQCGNNSITPRSSPVQTVSGGTNWKSVDYGLAHCAAIKTDGTLWTWGQGTNGQLGDSTLANKSSPVQTVSGGTNWKLVASGFYHTAAIKTDGTLWTWGSNINGQLGNNAITAISSPVQTVSGGTNWKLIDAGGYNTSCIKTDGTLWLWGKNGYGQLGDNTTANKSSPVQTVSAGTNWNLLGCGTYHSAAIKDDNF